MAKVIAINGSARKEGNTYLALKAVLQEVEKEGIETEILQLGGRRIFGCLACYKCKENKNAMCGRTDDEMNFFIEKAKAAQGIIIGSPVYFSNLTSDVKAFIDRCGFVGRANPGMLERKVGAAVVVGRRGGFTQTWSSINYFFGITGMIVPGSSYWNMGVGQKPGDVLNDAEGMATFRVLGQNVAWLVKLIYG